MIPRLYIETDLATGAPVPLNDAQAHYLKNVLRRDAGDSILLFNGRDGEFAAEITELKKKGGLAAVREKTSEQKNEPDLWLLFAPVKRGPLETIVQKSVELGVGEIAPIITERTNAPKVNRERLRAIAIEAAEQCGRMTVPNLASPVKLDVRLADWPQDRRLMFCDEAGDDPTVEWGGPEGRAKPALEILTGEHSNAHKWAIVIGPEGGFSPAERDMLRAHEMTTPVTLGPRILRADTAVIAAITLWQASLGDWRYS